MPNILSVVTATAVGLTCKTFINLGLCTMSVHGLPNLMKALESDERGKGRGIVTVSNHVSVLDDPMTWGVMPARTYLSTHLTRWSLGASDIMFTNPSSVFSAFFRTGQVLETFRGKGVYQPAVDSAIEKLSSGSWIHLFGEGKVCQPDTYEVEKGVARLIRFKWGVGRILIETPRPPIVIPVWITGFEDLMPEGRKWPYKYFPRLGTKLSVTFGDPIPPEHVLSALKRETPLPANTSGKWIPPGLVRSDEGAEGEENRRIRVKVTAIIQRAVEALGRQVSGDLLGKKTSV
ncbi:acyltransferase-domain-containing protein [Auriscalpium vulgare]|uniref:Acyltransferase-domain-containing protein n=1 Tax=Auriscalpium vulgare TaxID=40419 RepID=A0ACB8RWG8_9AGAM|nr:acyltransferase-domain-containing protein [Auriscalpium vulgare]